MHNVFLDLNLILMIASTSLSLSPSHTHTPVSHRMLLSKGRATIELRIFRLCRFDSASSCSGDVKGHLTVASPRPIAAEDSELIPAMLPAEAGRGGDAPHGPRRQSCDSWHTSIAVADEKAAAQLHLTAAGISLLLLARTGWVAARFGMQLSNGGSLVP